MKLQTFLFDLDGTLLDTVGLITTSLRHALHLHLGIDPPDPVVIQGLGTPLRGQFYAFTDDEPTIDALVASYLEHNLAHHDEGLAEYPGVTSLLTSLRARGARLGVVTSKPRGTAERGLRVCGLQDWFGVVVGADDVARHKPDPEPVLHALRHLGASPETAVFIGDSPFDIEAGRRAGVRTGAALWGPFARDVLAPYAPDHWLHVPGDVGLL